MGKSEKSPDDYGATIAGNLAAVKSPSSSGDSGVGMTLPGTPPTPASSGFGSSAGSRPGLAPVQPTLEPGTVLAGRYQIVDLLGEGGMGAVYKAVDLELERTVALKTILPQMASNAAMLARFKQEVLLASQITHRNVVRLYDLGEADGLKFITMEFVEGQDLRSVLEEHGKFSPDEAVSIMRQVCRALEAAHSQEVVHRDLKPQNIMRERRPALDGLSFPTRVPEDRIVVMDFGLARTLQSSGMTQTGALVGTMEYMSPEQALGEDVDARSDIFAVGLIFYELLSGQAPYKADSAIASLLKRTQQRAVPLSDVEATVPLPLSNVVGKCLERDRNARYQSAEELLQDLERLHAPNAAKTVARPVSLPKSASRLWRYGLAAVVLVLIIGAAATLFLRHRAPSRSQTQVATAPALSVAILPFHNVSGDGQVSWLSSSIAEMLGSDLGQSAQLHTVSTERIQQTLSDLRLGADTSFDPSMLRRVAGFVNADVVVWGRYMRTGNQIRVEATVQDLKNDRVVPLRIEAANDTELLNAVDKLAAQVRNNLALAPEVIKELTQSSFKPSSSSVEAIRAYNEGMQLSREGKNTEALKSFEGATKADANFALAWSQLGQTYAALGYDSEAENAARKAMQLAEALPARERYMIEAAFARTVNDTPKAIASYENLAKVSPDNTEIRLTLAGLYESNGDLSKAQETLQQVLTRDPKYVDALLSMGRVLIKSGKPQDGLDYLNRALTLSVQLNNDEERASILHATGVAYRYLNKPEEALQNYEQSLAIKRRIGQKRGIAVSLNEIATVQDGLGHLDKALAAYTEALQVRRDIGDKKGIGDTLMDLGGFYADHSQPEKALPYFKESLQIQRDLGDTALEALALNNIGNVYFSQGSYEDAQTYFERSLQIREKLNVPADMAQTMHNMAETEVAMGRFDEATDHYLKALDLQRKTGDSRGTAIESYSLGTVFEYQGRLSAALKAREDAVKTFRDLKDKTYWYVELLNGYGSSLAQLGRYDDAEKVLDEAAGVARELNLGDYAARNMLIQGDVSFYRGDRKAAKAVYQKALDLATRAKSRPAILNAKLRLAKVAAADNSAAPLSALSQLAREADSLGLKYASVEASIYLAQEMIAHKDYARARQELERALLVCDKLHLRPLTLQAQTLLGNALRLSGKSAEAESHYAQARLQLEDIRKQAGTDAVTKRADIARLLEPQN